MTDTLEQAVAKIKDKASVRKLLPTEKDFIGRPGYERKYTGELNHSGEPIYKWRYKYRPNVDGKWTKEGGEVLERMRPFMKADSERHMRLEAQKQRAKLKDQSGAVHYVEPHLASTAAQRNGWGHVVSRGRNRVEVGLDGMLFKLIGNNWHPLGRWCLSEPWGQAGRPKGGRRDGSMVSRGIQRDPDGVPWRFVEGEWRSL